MTVVTIGNTVRLQASFYDWGGNLADPADVTLRIYDHKKQQLGDDITTDISNPSAGVYQYEYTVPDVPMFYYEFSGTLEGKTVVYRKAVETRWAES